MRRTESVAALLLVAGLCCASPAAFAAENLSAAEARGKHIYTKGESTSNRIITANIAKAEAPTSASILPCIQCHGVDGRGIGIISPDINWDVLIDPEGHEHPQRAHGAYDEASLAHAIRIGRDPADNEFEATMPKYAMADADMDDLIAYLKVIDAELDPGVGGGAIRIGTVLPTRGPMAKLGNAMRGIFEAYFKTINSNGGIHGRDLELVVAEYGDDELPAFWQAQDLVRGDPVFALVGSYLPGFDEELSSLTETEKLPHVGPSTLLGTPGASHYEFFLEAGLVEQAKVLVEAVLAQALAAPAEAPRFAVVHPRGNGFDAAAEAVRELGAARTDNNVATVAYTSGEFDAAGAADILRKAGAEAVVFLGPAADLVALGEQAAALDLRPTLLAPAIQAERGVFRLPPDFLGEIFLSYASLPVDRTEEGAVQFEMLHADHGLDYSHSVAQVAAFSAVRVLVEALDRAGPAPTRERLVSALESLSDYRPGLTAAVSFTPERRLGPGGAWVVRVDRENGQLDNERRWVELD